MVDERRKQANKRGVFKTLTSSSTMLYIEYAALCVYKHCCQPSIGQQAGQHLWFALQTIGGCFGCWFPLFALGTDDVL